MLEDLDAINWDDLSHAFGSASDIPALIHALASPETGPRQAAFASLFDNVWNQGAVYEASAYVVPFLVELTQNPEVHERQKILGLLSHLATGNAISDIYPQQAQENLIPPNQLARERAWVQRTRQAVQNFIQIYLSLLEDNEYGVRAAAAYLLACFRERGQKIGNVLLRTIGREQNPLARASLILSLGAFAHGKDAFIQCFEFISRSNLSKLERLAATMALARNLREDTPESALEFLLDVVSSLDRTLPALYSKLPWADGHVAADASLVLCYFGQEKAGKVIPDLMRALNFVDGYSALNIAYALLFFTFGNQAEQLWWGCELTEMQVGVLSTLLDNGPIWDFGQEISGLMQMFGLPSYSDELEKLVENAII